MMKFTQELTFSVGENSVTFNGRDPFTIENAAFKRDLLAIGVFEEQENGDLVYTGKVSVPMKDGTEREVDPRGFIAANRADLHDSAKDTKAFR